MIQKLGWQRLIFIFKSYIFVSILVATNIGLAFSSEGHSDRPEFGFDINDINILFPFRDQKPYPIVRFKEFDNLVTYSIFEDVLKFEFPQSDIGSLPYMSIKQQADFTRWHLTSLRFDFCGDDLKFLDNSPHSSVFSVVQNSSNCQPRLRLVAQPLNNFGQPFVSALHLIYKIKSSSENNRIDKLIESFKQIKISSRDAGANTDGRMLGVHPGLESEKAGTDGTIAQKLVELIKSQVRLEELEVVTLILTTGTRHWKLVGGFVSNGKWQRFVTPLNRSTFEPNDTAVGVEEIKCNFYDICESFPQPADSSLKLLTDIFRKGRAQRPDIERQNSETTQTSEIVDGAMTNFFTTNCLSCHQSANYRDRQSINSTITNWPKGITPFSEKKFVGDGPSSIINFGYDGLTAKVSTRTTFEAAVATDRINNFLNLKNPGFVPTDLGSFWKCIMNTNINCLKENK